jgi:predicted negative regulator of RcsB-dependent stress response
MATYDLEEQEQLSAIKTWWRMYGNLVTGIAVAAAVAMVGWQVWQWHQRNQAAQAAAVYSALQEAVNANDAKKAKEAAGALLDTHGGTAYAAMGALLSAKVQVEAGDLKTARAQLSWAADNARDPALKDLARLRLAQVMLEEKSYDEALKQIEREPVEAFAARYAEVRGDIHAAQGKRSEARAAYQAALAKLGERAKQDSAQVAGSAAAFREMVQLKLDALGDAP